MNRKINFIEFALVLLLVAVSKFTPFSAILAFGLVLYYTTSDFKSSALVVCLVTLLSDALLAVTVYTEYSILYQGFYWQYFALILALIPIYFVKSEWSVLRVVFTTVSASTIFYLVSNLGAFLYLPMYAGTGWPGLGLSYIAGLPFYIKSLGSDLVTVVVIYGVLWSVRVARKEITI